MTQEAKKARADYMKKYQQENRERLNEYRREWARKNRDKIKEYEARQWQRKAAQSDVEYKTGYQIGR